LPYHYSEFLWGERDFVEYAKLSVDTVSERFFSMMAHLEMIQEMQVDKACQKIYGEIVVASKGYGRRTGCVDRSFMMLLYKLQADDCRLQPAFDFMPECFKKEYTDIRRSEYY
jgi:hypothetical protein